MYLGQLGNLHHFRCSHCGIDWHLTEKEFQEYQDRDWQTEYALPNTAGRGIKCPVCSFSV